jgi:hypothetical protein
VEAAVNTRSPSANDLTTVKSDCMRRPRELSPTKYKPPIKLPKPLKPKPIKQPKPIIEPFIYDSRTPSSKQTRRYLPISRSLSGCSNIISSLLKDLKIMNEHLAKKPRLTVETYKPSNLPVRTHFENENEFVHALAQYQVAEANVRAFIHEDADEQASINLIKQIIGTKATLKSDFEFSDYNIIIHGIYVKVKTLHVSTTNQYLNNFVSPKAPFYTNHNSSKFTHQNLNKSTFKFYEPNKRPPYRITALIPFPSKWDQSWITTNLISSLMPETSKKFTCVSIFFPIDMDDQAIIEISLKTQHMVDWFLTQNPPTNPKP